MRLAWWRDDPPDQLDEVLALARTAYGWSAAASASATPQREASGGVQGVASAPKGVQGVGEEAGDGLG